MKQWPNLFVVGAAKAGTTTLYHYLAQHPDIFMSPHKEPHFFSQVRPSVTMRAFIKNISDEARYLALFSAADKQRYRGEASTSYLWEPGTAARIKKASPDAKIIIMLRDPVSRAYSHFLNDAREGWEKRGFYEALREDMNTVEKGWGVSSLYVDLGYYPEQIQRYFRHFGRDRVHIVFFEEFIREPETHVAAIFHFLKLDNIAAVEPDKEKQNEFATHRFSLFRDIMGSALCRRIGRAIVPPALRTMVRQVLLVKGKKPGVDPAAKRLLTDVYREQRAELAQLLGRDVPWALQ